MNTYKNSVSFNFFRFRFWLQSLLLRQLWIVNYYIKSSSNNLSNENIKKRNDISKIVHIGISIHVLSWRQQKHQCLCFPYWDYLTNFWQNNWRFIIDVVERLLMSFQKPFLVTSKRAWGISSMITFLKLLASTDKCTIVCLNWKTLIWESLQARGVMFTIVKIFT